MERFREIKIKEFINLQAEACVKAMGIAQSLGREVNSYVTAFVIASGSALLHLGELQREELDEYFTNPMTERVKQIIRRDYVHVNPNKN